MTSPFSPVSPKVVVRERLNLRLPPASARWLAGQALFHGVDAVDMLRSYLAKMAEQEPVIPIWTDHLPAIREIQQLGDDAAIAYLQGLHFRKTLDPSAERLAEMANSDERIEMAAMVMAARQFAATTATPQQRLGIVARQALIVARLVESPTSSGDVLAAARAKFAADVDRALQLPPAPAEPKRHFFDLVCTTCGKQVEVAGDGSVTPDPSAMVAQLGWHAPDRCSTCPAREEAP